MSYNPYWLRDDLTPIHDSICSILSNMIFILKTCDTLLCSYLIHFLTICRRFEIIWTNIHLLRIFFLKTVEFGNWLFLITICLQPFTTVYNFWIWILIFNKYNQICTKNLQKCQNSASNTFQNIWKRHSKRDKLSKQREKNIQGRKKWWKNVLEIFVSISEYLSKWSQTSGRL